MNDEFDRIVREFRWEIPARYNLGRAVSDLPASRGLQTAVVAIDSNWNERRFSFSYLSKYSNKFANKLAALNLQRNDRVAVLLPQSIEAAVAHIAIWKLGLISVPLQINDRPDAIAERIRLSSASVIVTTESYAETLGQVSQSLPDLRSVIAVMRRPDATDCVQLEQFVSGASEQFRIVTTHSDDPAILAFTSGTEGEPKGVLHTHRIVLGALPAMLFSAMPCCTDLMWSHFDWGWLGGLLVPLIGWHCGAAVLIKHEQILDPFATIDLLREFGATRLSLAPTALKMLQSTIEQPRCPKVINITAGGEKLDDALRGWVLSQFGVSLGELYGLTECGAVLGSGDRSPPRAGALGKPPPGQNVVILAEDGSEAGLGEVGFIGVKSPHPQMFLGYWRDQPATASRFLGPYFNTGDVGSIDESGYFCYKARAAEIIKVGANRVGPSEIEQQASRHPAVAVAAAIGIPDPISGEAILLCIELQEGWSPTLATEQKILAFLRRSLARYKIPRRIRFVDEMPRSTNGKVSRVKLRNDETIYSIEN